MLLKPVNLLVFLLEAGLELSDGPLGLSQVVLQRPGLLIVGPEQSRQLSFLPNQPNQGLVLPLQQPVEDSVLLRQFLCVEVVIKSFKKTKELRSRSEMTSAEI